MITSKDIKAAIIEKLRSRFPNYEYYSGLEVIEGYEKPCFFTFIEILDVSKINTNISNTDYLFLIDYFQPEKDEIDLLEKMEEIINLFLNGFKVKDRYIVPELSQNYIGKNKNILEIELSFSVIQEITKEETEDKIENVKVNLQKEKD